MTDAAYACNGAAVSRSEFYAIACDPRRSVAVEACAGAGTMTGSTLPAPIVFATL